METLQIDYQPKFMSPVVTSQMFWEYPHHFFLELVYTHTIHIYFTGWQCLTKFTFIINLYFSLQYKCIFSIKFCFASSWVHFNCFFLYGHYNSTTSTHAIKFIMTQVINSMFRSLQIDNLVLLTRWCQYF